jgi:hypothetical protein
MELYFMRKRDTAYSDLQIAVAATGYALLAFAWFVGYSAPGDGQTGMVVYPCVGGAAVCSAVPLLRFYFDRTLHVQRYHRVSIWLIVTSKILMIWAMIATVP